jgi:hypothetical protein
MSLLTTFQQIKKTLPRTSRAYAQGRTTPRALAPYESPADVLAALGTESPLSVEERDAVLLAVVNELQQGRDPLWQSILLLAFERMLSTLRAGLGHRRSEDVDQQVLLTFLEAAKKTRIVSHAARALRLATQREMFFRRKVEQREPRTKRFKEETHDPDPFEVDADAKAAASEIVSFLEEEGGEELRDLMLETYAADGSVNEYVDRIYHGLTVEARAATCDRLRRLRQRAVTKLRERAQRCDTARRVGAA